MSWVAPATRCPDRRPASAIKVIAWADDSSDIGSACGRLLDLHPKAPAAAHAPVGKTIDWMMKVQFDGEVDYFELDPVIAQRIFSKLQHHTWWRIVRMMRTRHRWKWTEVRRWLTDSTGRWHPISAGGIELCNPETIPIIRYHYRGNQDPQPLGPGCLNQPTAETMESQVR